MDLTVERWAKAKLAEGMERGLAEGAARSMLFTTQVAACMLPLRYPVKSGDAGGASGRLR